MPRNVQNFITNYPISVSQQHDEGGLLPFVQWMRQVTVAQGGKILYPNLHK